MSTTQKPHTKTAFPTGLSYPDYPFNDPRHPLRQPVTPWYARAAVVVLRFLTKVLP